MRIGIDIDGCINNTHQTAINSGIKWLLKRDYQEIIFHDRFWDFDKFFQVKPEDLEQFVKEVHTEAVTTTTVREKASEVIQFLKDEGHHIVIITGRSKYDPTIISNNGDYAEITKQWLATNHIYYDEIVFNGMDKAQECLDYNIDVMVEDWPEAIIEIAKNTKVLMFKNTYNETIKGDNITPVYTWYDVYLKIKNMNKK